MEAIVLFTSILLNSLFVGVSLSKQLLLSDLVDNFIPSFHKVRIITVEGISPVFSSMVLSGHRGPGS